MSSAYAVAFFVATTRPPAGIDAPAGNAADASRSVNVHPAISTASVPRFAISTNSSSRTASA
ncbi:MAG: hypothetical protein A3K66_04815 [Euryarchaeota archaeon RBG_16_67_27]|nr:MAG: hypothetical protein A3K66_04815 [Euryarchaeota archaeon RBG_16_67_27]